MQNQPSNRKTTSGMNPKNTKKMIIAGILLIELIFAVFAFSSSQVFTSDVNLPAKSASIDFNTGVINLSSEAMSEIYAMPKVYTLPFNSEPGPIPDQNKYTNTTDAQLLSEKVTTFNIDAWDGSEIIMYEDETIQAYLWKERIDIETEETYNFADITIAHPSQIRRYYAGGEYQMNTRFYPQTMAQTTNSVVAITGDFYNYRTYGVVVNNGIVYRDEPRTKMPYVLFVDRSGDLNIEYCPNGYDVQGYVDNNDINFSVSFGPALVKDGHILTPKEALNYEGEGWIYGWAPRAALGQLGELHYLICTVDGKNPGYHGTRSYILAQVMNDKGCYIAYNLDGGHTATLVVGGNVFNRVAFGGQRASSDILYFATAIPNE